MGMQSFLAMMLTAVMLTGKVHSEFIHYLLTKASQPGDRLPPLNELSTELGLSVGKLREQMEVARVLGLVEVSPRRGIVRTAHSYVPMDEALALVAVDLGGRAYCVFEADFTTPRLGQLGTDLIFHLFETLAIQARMNLHAKVFYGRNDHHKVEALFKALARALDAATTVDPRRQDVPSTKGTLTA